MTFSSALDEQVAGGNIGGVAHDPRKLSDGLPAPVDDGACDHLVGLTVPHLRLTSTHGDEVDIADLASGPAVVYVYPRTGVPGVEMPDGWDLIPGARGCTPQSCSYRGEHGAFRDVGVSVFGLSTLSTQAQHEFAVREHLPFTLLSDPEIAVGNALGLPTFLAGGAALYKRVTLIIEAGEIVYARYPVFPADTDADITLAWLRSARP